MRRNSRQLTVSRMLPVLLLVAIFLLTGCEIRAQRSDPIDLNQTNVEIQPPVVDPVAPAGNGQTDAAEEVAPGTGTEGVIIPEDAGGSSAEGDAGTSGEAGESSTDNGTSESGSENTSSSNEANNDTGTVDDSTAGNLTADGKYIVQSGDSLGRIAELFDISVEDIAAANGITNVDELDVDQELIIPEAGFAEQETASSEPTEPTDDEGSEETAANSDDQVHVVRPGDTLFSLGLLYGFTVEELQQYNGLANPNTLDIGQEIKIPPTE